ncbi:hypothetical protein, partial [uncultured Dubosiella sp.]|uniref:hypothetical protein n=1 Tax=uncultured Dubosiella sp. TaxID=1937011 RepID=UPI00259AF4A5
ESLEKEVPALRTSIQNAQNQIAQDSKRQTQARAYLAQLHGAKDAWNAIKKGQSANFDPTFDDLAAFPDLFANYWRKRSWNNSSPMRIQALNRCGRPKPNTKKRSKQDRPPKTFSTLS